MRHIIPFLLFFTFLSCAQKENRKQQADTPKALQENKENSLIEYSKRGPNDLVDELYDENLENAPELKNLDKKFNDLNKSKIDSLTIFHTI